MRVLEGKLVDNGTRVGIVAARFNEFIVSKLVAGAQDGLIRHGVSDDNIDLAWVPGAFEIPLIASKTLLFPEPLLPIKIDNPCPNSKFASKSSKFLYFLIFNFLSFTKNGLLKFFFRPL